MNVFMEIDLQPNQSILVLHEGDNPTSDFYLKSRLAELSLPVRWVSLNEHPDPTLLSNTYVIVVRYLTPAWRRLLDKRFDSLAGCVWLIDDDLLDFSVLIQVSRGLGWKWFWRAWRFKSWFKRKNAALWVSTPYLARKYTDWKPIILPPCSPYASSPKKPSKFEDYSKHPVVFYHGSISHWREQKWLCPIFVEVAKQLPEVVFEIIGNAKVARYFESIPQVRVEPPMSWQSYKQWIQRPGRRIGLAPLLDDPVNAARAPTRFYDIQAAGAIGLYAVGPVYQDVVIDGVNGFMLEMDQGVWVEKIVKLLVSGNTL